MVVESKLPQLHQLQDGLRVGGLLNEIQKNPVGFQACFVASTDEFISLQRIYEEIEPVFALEGSNKIVIEENIFKHFCDYLEKAFYDGMSFNG